MLSIQKEDCNQYIQLQKDLFLSQRDNPVTPQKLKEFMDGTPYIPLDESHKSVYPVIRQALNALPNTVELDKLLDEVSRIARLEGVIPTIEMKALRIAKQLWLNAYHIMS